MKKTKKKGDIVTIVLVAVLVIGLSLVLYPSFSNWVNSFSQSKAITSYLKVVSYIPDEEYVKYWEDAREYNKKITPDVTASDKTDEETAEYDGLLNIDGNGVMGYLEIQSIGVKLPIYHGTSEDVLGTALGHLDWTSLPVGGESTHTVISGHRGLPSAKLLTDLDKMVVGDTFTLNILDDILTYEVDQILIIDPADTSNLKVVNGEDLCTLMTCTPYGINTHRLLVRGHRIDNIEEAKTIRVSADAIQINEYLVAIFIAAPVLLFMLFFLSIKDIGKGKNKISEQSGGEEYE